MEKLKEFYAHSLENEPPEKWQKLEDHLKGVSELAAKFARPFGGEEWAYLAGLWHDLGKYSDAFQARLFLENGFETHIETHPGRVIHSEAGGHLASLKGWKGIDRLLSWLIMGHHAGLADFESDKTGAKALVSKMREPERAEKIIRNVPADLINRPMPTQKFPKGAEPSFFIRMLFSCIVDADYLDTEIFMDKDKAKERNIKYPTLEKLETYFETHMQKLLSDAKASVLNGLRADVLAQCRKAAMSEEGIYSLTVPTGGGKTLSSLAFALRHAVEYGKKRIIYIIPYTNIIEQTVEVFRKIQGFENAVIEHHCNVIVEDETKETSKSRLAIQNWDAPIIVTTAVQFFESLYASKSSRCRRLHNIVNSVIIFDEAQYLPPEYLRPAVFAIRELHRFYHVTPVLCTATQPVLTKTEQFDFKFKEGFDTVKEIISDPVTLSAQLKRTKVELFNHSFQPVDYKEIANAILDSNQSTLCIVNRKDDCRALYRMLPSEQSIHLSTNMCAEHRFQKLKEIHIRLQNKQQAVYVISTSLVEAGVDLDFPVVYRALSGLDSIAQAAGRCNREGKLEGLGKVVVFVPEKQPSYIKQPASIAEEFLNGDLDNLFSPVNYERYFRQRFWQLGEGALDQHGILELLGGRMDYYFRTASESFKLINDDWQLPVIVPFNNSNELVARMIVEDRYYYYLRKLQRYTINLPQYLHNRLVDENYIHPVSEFQGLFMLNPILYDNEFGFIPPDEVAEFHPEKMIY